MSKFRLCSKNDAVELHSPVSDTCKPISVHTIVSGPVLTGGGNVVGRETTTLVQKHLRDPIRDQPSPSVDRTQDNLRRWPNPEKEMSAMFVDSWAHLCISVLGDVRNNHSDQESS